MIAIVRHAVRRTEFAQIMRRSAALAYYAALSLAPLVLVAVAIASMAWDRGTVRDQIISEMGKMVGPTGADLIMTILDQSSERGDGILGAILGGAMLLIGATGVFAELQSGLNAIWQIRAPRGGGIWPFLRTRILSAAMVFTIGFLLLVSLLVNAALTALLKSVRLADTVGVGLAVHMLVSVLGSSLLFAALFKFLPDARVRWRDVVFGAVATGILFNLGQFGIGQYIARAGVGSAFGAAGSLVIILVWVYYSAAIVFFGAELTESRADLLGHGITSELEAERR